jgi:hypothetical protein
MCFQKAPPVVSPRSSDGWTRRDRPITYALHLGLHRFIFRAAVGRRSGHREGGRGVMRISWDQRPAYRLVALRWVR